MRKNQLTIDAFEDGGATFTFTEDNEERYVAKMSSEGCLSLFYSLSVIIKEHRPDSLSEDLWKMIVVLALVMETMGGEDPIKDIKPDPGLRPDLN